MEDSSCQEHTDNQHRASEQQDFTELLVEDVVVRVERTLEDQRRQQQVQDEVGVELGKDRHHFLVAPARKLNCDAQNRDDWCVRDFCRVGNMLTQLAC